MIAWMYCVGEGWRSCEDATMSKSLPVASLFCWFCKYEVHELVYFLTFRKNGIMFCFVLFCSFGNRSESFLFEWSTFLFLVQKHWYVKFLRWVGWWGEGWVGWTAKRTTSRTCFLYISDKKGTFHFHFSDKIHIKRNFLKKGTKWQSLVNSRKKEMMGRKTRGMEVLVVTVGILAGPHSSHQDENGFRFIALAQN